VYLLAELVEKRNFNLHRPKWKEWFWLI